MNGWIKKDLKYVWHPYTQMKDCLDLPPILIDRAKGMKLYDDKGRFYYDTISSWWCNVHGHNHPAIKRAIKRQLDSLEHVLFAGFTHRGAILLAEKLIAVTPKTLTKVFFTDNGSTAVETALKLSFQYWQNRGEKRKRRFASLDYGYHGDTIGAMSVGGVDLFNEVFSPLFFDSYKVPSPYCYRCPVKKERSACGIDCIRPLKALLKKRHKEIAALILEPIVMAAGGMIVYPAEYLKKAASLAREYDVHLILDEVATGFGRTGRMFACEHAGVEPDFMCLSKGLTSGFLPMAATLTTEEIYRAFCADYAKKKTFYHGHTYAANPVACAAALASIRIFEEEKTLDRVKEVMPVFHRGLERFRGFPIVGDIRYIGMIGCMELVKNRRTGKEFGLDERIGLEIYKEGLKKNLILRPLGNITYFFLPLCVKRKEVSCVMESAYEVMGRLAENHKKRVDKFF